MIILIALLGIIMILSAIYALRAKKLLNAVITSGVISLFASILYLIMAAPDVAMTEASIGSGLTTIVFLFAIKKIKKGAEDD